MNHFRRSTRWLGQLVIMIIIAGRRAAVYCAPTNSLYAGERVQFAWEQIAPSDATTTSRSRLMVSFLCAGEQTESRPALLLMARRPAASQLRARFTSTSSRRVRRRLVCPSGGWRRRGHMISRGRMCERSSTSETKYTTGNQVASARSWGRARPIRGPRNARCARQLTRERQTPTTGPSRRQLPAPPTCRGASSRVATSGAR